MNINETFKTSLRQLGANKARTFLTMLGVIIGVFAVTSLVSIGQGIRNYITDQFNAIGSNLIFVVPGRADFSRDPAESFSKNKLDEEHIDLINTFSKEYVEYVTPQYTAGETIFYRNKSFAGSVMGVNESIDKIFNVGLSEGKYFTRVDVRSKNKVAIIGESIRSELFANQTAIGKKIKIGDDSYTVIGVQEKKGRDFDESVLVPYTALAETSQLDKFSSIIIKARDVNNIDITMKQIEASLMRDLDDDDFSVLSQEDLLSSIQQILGALTAGLGAIAGISLLVGGIGIMNIMLVSVTERIKEIGLRKAVGATSKNIALQFMFESVLISVFGGMIGLIFGWLTTQALQSYVRAEIPLWGVIVAFGFSVVVGVAFGTYPAVKASKLDPIEALRYE